MLKLSVKYVIKILSSIIVILLQNIINIMFTKQEKGVIMSKDGISILHIKIFNKKR